jgi:hypothetical protein
LGSPNFNLFFDNRYIKDHWLDKGSDRLISIIKTVKQPETIKPIVPIPGAPEVTEFDRKQYNNSTETKHIKSIINLNQIDKMFIKKQNMVGNITLKNKIDEYGFVESEEKIYTEVIKVGVCGEY